MLTSNSMLNSFPKLIVFKQSMDKEILQLREKMEVLREEVLLEHQDSLETAMKKVEREKLNLEEELAKMSERPRFGM